MKKFSCLWLLLFSSCLIWGQSLFPSRLSCTEKFYLEKLSSTDSSVSITCMLNLPGGDLLICGGVNDAGVSTATITRVTPEGVTVWEKKVSPRGGAYFNTMIALQDGNFMVAGSYNDGTYANLLMKIDPAGNILFKKHYYYGGSETCAISALREDADRSIIAVTKFVEGPLGFQDRIAYQKYSSTGALVYSKKIGFEKTMVIADVNDLVIVNGHSYFAAMLHDGYFNCGLVVNMDNATGGIVWTKIFRFNGGPVYFKQIFFNNGNLVICGNNNDYGFDAGAKTLIYTATLNGTLLHVSYLACPFSVGYSRFSIEPDGTIYMGTTCFDYPNYRLGLARIDPSGQVKWMTGLNLPGVPRLQGLLLDNGALYFSGNSYPGLYNGYAFLGKFSLAGESTCNSVKYEPSFGTGTSDARDTLSVALDKPLSEINHPFTFVTAAPALVEPVCEQQSICDSISLPDTLLLCLSADTIQVSAYRNPGCLKNIRFKVDNNYLHQTVGTDTSGRFVMHQPGMTKVYASLLTECGTLEDSIVVIIRSSTSFNLGGDTTLCPGTTMQLHAPPGYDYLWSDGSPGDTHTVSAAGKYFLTATSDCGVLSDTIAVQYEDPSRFSLGPDQTVCDLEGKLLEAPPGYTGYKWFPSYGLDHDDTRSVQTFTATDTIYSCEAYSVNGCKVSDIVRVFVRITQPLHVGNDTTICSGTPVTLGNSGTFASYVWNSGSTAPEITVTQPGTYWLRATMLNGCTISDTVEISGFPKPDDFLPVSVVKCTDETITMRASGTFTRYLWSTGDSTSTIDIHDEGTYVLKVMDDNGCNFTKFVVVTNNKCYPGISYPNAFTPNHDGRNDSYKPVIGMPVTGYRFEIFNRWGMKVFSTTDPLKGWDGIVTGKFQDSGVFLWTCTYTVAGSSSRRDKGFVVLVK